MLTPCLNGLPLEALEAYVRATYAGEAPPGRLVDGWSWGSKDVIYPSRLPETVKRCLLESPRDGSSHLYTPPIGIDLDNVVWQRLSNDTCDDEVGNMGGRQGEYIAHAGVDSKHHYNHLKPRRQL